MVIGLDAKPGSNGFFHYQKFGNNWSFLFNKLTVFIYSCLKIYKLLETVGNQTFSFWNGREGLIVPLHGKELVCGSYVFRI